MLGSVCRFFAAKHPEMVHRLVLYAPIVAGLGEEDVNEAFHPNTWESAASDFQRKVDGSIEFSIYIENAWHYDKDSSPNGGRRDLFVSKSVRLIPTENIKAPVLIIVGSEDPYVSAGLCEEAYKTLPNQKDSQIVIVKGAAHAMMMERPYYRLFRERVLNVLNRKA